MYRGNDVCTRRKKRQQKNLPDKHKDVYQFLLQSSIGKKYVNYSAFKMNDLQNQISCSQSSLKETVWYDKIV